MSFLLVGMGIAIMVSIGPNWANNTASSATANQLNEIHSDLQEACNDRPQHNQLIDFGDSSGAITVCGTKNQRLCFNDIKSERGLEDCDSIEIHVENGENCEPSGDFLYDAQKSDDSTVLLECR